METDELSPASKTAEKFVVRLPRGMRRRIAGAAREYRRSMNSEIVARLERSLNEPFAEAATAPLTAPPNQPHYDAMTYQGVAERGGETAAADGLSELERMLVRLFRNLPEARQRALLELLT